VGTHALRECQRVGFVTAGDAENLVRTRNGDWP
jgi:hypothetical protein